jgi:nicotinamide riboside kinase
MKLFSLFAALVVVATAASSPEAQPLPPLPPPTRRRSRSRSSQPETTPEDLETLFQDTRRLTSTMFSNEPLVEVVQKLLDLNRNLTGKNLAVETTDLEAIAKICCIETIATDPKTNTTRTFSFAQHITDIAATETITNHIHTGCDKFHKEDGHSHGVLAMLNVLSDQLTKGVDQQTRVRRGFTALIHDIAKKDSKMVMKKGAAYPCHGLLGGCLLRMIDILPFALVLSADKFAVMSATLEHHMCGFNTSPCEFKMDTLSVLPQNIQQELRHLAVGDSSGKIGMSTTSSCLFQTCDSLGYLSVNDYLSKYSLQGVVFSITGASASGKTTLTRQIVEKFGAERVTVVSRDEFILAVGRELLKNEEALYKKCYQVVKSQKKSSRVNELMKDTITKAVCKGQIVILDTCLTMYGKARTFFFKDTVLEKCLIVDVYPVRQSPITDDDCRRHDMAMPEQLSASSKFSPWDIGFYLGGKKGVDFHAMNRRARTTMTQPKKGSNPCFAVSVSSKPFTNSSSFGAPVFNAILDWVSDFHPLSLVDETKGMNVTEFINYCWSCTSGVTTLERVVSLQEMLAVHHYDVKVQNRIVETTDEKDIEYFTDNVEVVIKYRDGVNQLWKEPWMVNMRAVPILFTKGEIVILPNMDRGPEVVGHAGNQDQVQDFDPSKKEGYDLFSDTTKALALMMNRFTDSTDGLTRIIATSKRDGMCGRFFRIDQATDSTLFAFYQRVLRSYNNAFINAFVDASPKGVLFVPASNGTAIFTSETVWTWFACAIGYSYGVTSAMQKEIGSADKVLRHVVVQFVGDLVKLNLPSRGCALFEMVCPNRADPITGIVHTELATGYTEEESGITFLSYSHLVDGAIVNVPHTEIKHPFREPSFWVFGENFVENVRGLLTAFDNTFSGEITMDALFEKFPRANRNIELTNLPDPEGLVLYAEVGGKLIYLKAKTDKYYVLHKVRIEKISLILSLPHSFGKYYPAYTIIHQFFADTTHLNHIVTSLSSILESDDIRQEAVEKFVNAKRTFDSLPPFAQVNNLVQTTAFNDVAPKVFADVVGLVHTTDEKLCQAYSALTKEIILSHSKNPIKFESVEQVKATVITPRGAKPSPFAEIFKLVGGIH